MIRTIHRNVPFTEYLGWPRMSQSVLKAGRKSMMHLSHAMTTERTATDAMLVGSALHTAFLEPEEFDGRVVLWEGAARRGKKWEAFKESHAEQIILTSGHFYNVCMMVGMLRKNPDIAMWRDTIEDGNVEVSATGIIEGVPFKGRVDALTSDPLFDLKSISSIDRRTIDNTIYTYGYHIQAWCYLQLFDRRRFILGLVESTAPFDVAVVELSDEWIEIGGVTARDLLAQVRRCIDTDQWPGMYSESILAEPPEWVLDKYGPKVTLGGVEL